ncbi:glycosyltransferase [Halalkalibacterium halodurans]|uniref:Exopolysaccharide biosynthesis n=1 Tax=Halalkalibacterium halodurans (strain ATCC BAA-125 / DSM 18197 / FERM 7344 / JCM 9153 / C-125) TaxID=272558 RepID=Q9K6L5_HALH5|nr:glycosyltransferase [Halalkalibacterium halodurans]MED4170865.1 glycosyltransferase [Halalkalibacterium halodurans]BAB07433.1 exopolysaccharide biosynthesis [Halalkalibacterium halodurans C-125]
MNPEVTVLMSVYNDKNYLSESIESILNQTFENFEFLIINDASTDGSGELLEEYSKKDKRIRLIHNKNNRGLSYSLAEGVSLAKAPWIARMDADDVSFKDRLAVQMDHVKAHSELDILGSYVIDIDDKGNELEIRKVPTTHKEIANLIWTCPFIHPTVLFKKDSIIKAGSYDRNLRRRQDYDLWFRCLEAKLKFENIDKPLLYYRSTDDYYKKNNFKVQVQQAKMGFAGARRVKAKPIAYIGITVAFIKGILPYHIRKPLSQLLKKVDPRRA